jgi:hypothetical protein
MEIMKGNPRMAKKSTPGTGHNGTGLTEDQEKIFIVELQNYTDAEASMAEKKGSMSGIVKRLEAGGFSTDHIKWAKRLRKENVASIINDLKIKIGIARLMGHAAGRQLDIFEDRTPLEDQAYLEGLSAGKLGMANSNPYGMETAAGQRWQQGSNEGHTLRNAWLNQAISAAAEADLIKSPTTEEIADEAHAEDEDAGAEEDSAVEEGSGDQEGDELATEADTDHALGEDPAEAAPVGADDQAQPDVSGTVAPTSAGITDDDWDAPVRTVPAT